MRFITVLVVLALTNLTKASGWFGDSEFERKFLDGIILANIDGLHACIRLSNAGGPHAKGEVDILMELVPGEKRPLAAVVYVNKTGNIELGTCLVRRFEAAAIELPTGMYRGPYIVRLNIVAEGSSQEFSGLKIYDPRPLGPYSK